MKKRLKILAFNTVRAPYRVDLYNQLGFYFDLTVFFEQRHDSSRSKEWYSNDFRNFRMKHAKKWEKSLRWPKLDVISALGTCQYDIVYMSEWSTITSLMLMFACLCRRIPYILSIDGHNNNKQSNFVKDTIKKFFAQRAAAIIGTGKTTTTYAKSLGVPGEKIYSIGFTTLFEREILSSPVTDEEKNEIKNNIGLDVELHYVLYAGQLVVRKGVDLLLRAWSQCKSPNSWSWRLLIVGDGVEKENLQKIKSQLNLDTVDFIPNVSKEKLLSYYKASDLFVLNTREDIWGLVVNEAMANGLPVLTTFQCVAGGELIENDINGYLYDCNDVDSCARYLSKLMNEEKLRWQIGVNNINKIKSFTIESEAKRIRDIIDSII